MRRNCRNRKRLKHPVLVGDEWNKLVPASYHKHEVMKIDDLKFFECPQSFITRSTWQILAFINETTNADCEILQPAPFPGTYLEQPSWYREARKMVRGERNSEWNHELRMERAKAKAGNH